MKNTKSQLIKSDETKITYILLLKCIYSNINNNL